jgi:uncharacterized cupredoxin-like copper-binding protein
VDLRCGFRLGSLLALGACVAAVLAVTGSAGSAGFGAVGAVLQVNERDFAIKAPQHVSSGAVTLRVRNHGPDAHELIVVKTHDGRLPLRADGLTVDEDAVQHATVGALEPGQSGSRRELHLRLSPGRYVLFCNMSGHYLGGMRHVLVVR